ncbi:hypothetical protein RCG42_04795, partial [Lactobacillus delbrueckii subsp. lactis]|uniref:hypothetical protein n=1 Tax=Lactobacillus delbrueckii TaxID=1584 RepID=UPI0027E5D10D
AGTFIPYGDSFCFAHYTNLSPLKGGKNATKLVATYNPHYALTNNPRREGTKAFKEKSYIINQSIFNAQSPLKGDISQTASCWPFFRIKNLLHSVQNGLD